MPESKNILTSTQVLVGVVTALITALVALVGAFVQIGLLHPHTTSQATPYPATPTRSSGVRSARRPPSPPSAGGATSSTPPVVAVAPTSSAGVPVTAPAGSPAGPAPPATPTPNGSSVATGPATANAHTVDLLAPDALAVPLGSLDQSLQRQTPGGSVQANFGSSLPLVQQATSSAQPADVLAVADARLLPAGAASWYVGFASDAIVVAYTDASKDAASITPDNCY